MEITKASIAVAQEELCSVRPEAAERLARMGAHVVQFGPESALAVKIGGGNDIDKVADAMAHTVRLGITPVLLHGGGPQIDDGLAKAGKVSKKADDGLRITEPDHMPIIEAAMERQNAHIVDKLCLRGIGALGLKGIIKARPLDPERYGVTGEATGIEIAKVKDCVADGRVPVISCLAKENNVNADDAFKQLVDELNPLVALSVTPEGGVKQRDAEGNLTDYISVIRPQDLPELMAKGIIEGGMVKKLTAGLAMGRNLLIVDPDHIRLALFAEGTYGTQLLPA